MPHTKVWIHEQYEDRFVELLFDSCSELYDLAERRSVELCIENACNFDVPFINRALDQLCRAFSNFYLTWDVGHDAKANYREQTFILSHPDRVRHMHMHDYNGKSDHQPLFTGQVPIDDRIRFAMTHNLSVVVEVKTSSSLQESIFKVREFLK